MPIYYPSTDGVSGDGSALTNLNASELASGTVPIERIPVLPSQEVVVSSGGISDLTSQQQNKVVTGSVVTTTDGRRWVYTGSGSKTTEASYIELADTTPDWSTITNKPAFGTAALVADNTLVHTSGAETIAGVKTFSDPIVVSGTGITGLTKSQVGLGNVDNTSDANKPISTATQTALNGKAAASHVANHDVNGTDSLYIHAELVTDVIDWAKNAYLWKEITGDTEFTFSNLTSGRTIILVLDFDEERNITWPGEVIWLDTPAASYSTKTVFTLFSVNGDVYGRVS